jgi:ribosome-binding factor A
LLRQRLSEVLLRGDLHDPDLARASITVGEVQVSPDLRHAKVFVLPLGGVGTPEAIAALTRNAGEIRHQVVKGLNLKYAPALKFIADETFDRMDETRILLSDDVVRRDVARSEGDEDDA